MKSDLPSILISRIRGLLLGLGLLFVSPLLPGCITTRVTTEPDCNTPANVTYTQQTTTAYFWGLKQPTDITPPCDRRFNHLNGVTVKSTFAHYLLSTVTLGVVNKRHVRWCCAPYVPPTDSI
ncbi:hypothetical protein [Spirosoma endbachense]|uniref:Uncharacterized protein n=1 Tax=Spirosoma endbachense TaxID=2666025 RepID=A0A6P1W3Z7_9BACT|nr:hypothetical protein [Spirosoma endbachense]QHV99614.1 hypothetical protein GJR95_33430 [Spirosoma endbachense]